MPQRRFTAKTHVFKNDDLEQVLHTSAKDGAFTKTKVCFTMGPSTHSVDLLCDILEAGATCARIDLTWELLDHHRHCLQLLQEAMRKTRRLCAVMLDCLGRDILVKRPFNTDDNGWPVHVEKLTITAGQKVVITTDVEAKCTEEVFPITYSKFPSMVNPGDSIFLGRYLVTGADESSLYLEVVEVGETEVVCEAVNGAVLEGLLTIFHQERSAGGLANLQNDKPVLDDWDKLAIETLCEEFEIDFITLSFCRSPEDVTEARNFLTSIGKEGIKVVAKCETRQSLLNFRSISAAADAIIISRGNLGLDVAAEKMALIQKAIISTCAVLGKPSLITRVVDTMSKSPRPTRAEATDIANAVLDGVDGIMLGAETFRGKYPLETVRTVVAVAREAELVFDHNHHFEHLQHDSYEHHHHYDHADEADPELPRSRSSQRMNSHLGRQNSGGSMLSDVTGITGFHYSHSANQLPRSPANPATMNSKLESIASSAVKAADKVGASLIICLTHTGKTASMLARYRPPMPIMTLVVPYLKNEGLKWTLEGRSVARQALLTSGLLPVLAAPTPSAGESLLEEAIALAAGNGLVMPHDHVVAVSLSSHREAMVKIVSVSGDGMGIKKIRPASLIEMIKAASARHGIVPETPPQVEDRPVAPSPVTSPEASAAAPAPSAPAAAPAASTAHAAGARAVFNRLSRGSVIIGRKADPLVHFDE